MRSIYIYIYVMNCNLILMFSLCGIVLHTSSVIFMVHSL